MEAGWPREPPVHYTMLHESRTGEDKEREREGERERKTKIDKERRREGQRTESGRGQELRRLCE